MSIAKGELPAISEIKPDQMRWQRFHCVAKMIVEVKSYYHHITWFIFHLILHARQCWYEWAKFTFFPCCISFHLMICYACLAFFLPFQALLNLCTISKYCTNKKLISTTELAKSWSVYTTEDFLCSFSEYKTSITQFSFEKVLSQNYCAFELINLFWN